MYWKCPKCKSKVDFSKQMGYVFSEDDEADFDAKRGLFFHTIECENKGCNATWIVSISEMNEDEL